MHKRNLCRVALSVRPFVCLPRSCILSKRINTFLNFSTILVFQYRNIPIGPPPTNVSLECMWGRHKSRCSTNIGLWIDDFCSANNYCERPPRSLPQRRPRASYLCLSQPAWTTTTKKTEEKIINFVRSGKSEAKVINNR